MNRLPLVTARLTIAAAFVATIIGANDALTRWGVVPVGLGLEAPAVVYFAGLAFGLRDALHELGGRPWVLAAIAAGAVVSYALEDGASIPGGHAPVAVASASAFALSELADLAVHAPLRARPQPAQPPPMDREHRAPAGVHVRRCNMTAARSVIHAEVGP